MRSAPACLRLGEAAAEAAPIFADAEREERKLAAVTGLSVATAVRASTNVAIVSACAAADRFAPSARTGDVMPLAAPFPRVGGVGVEGKGGAVGEDASCGEARASMRSLRPWPARSVVIALTSCVPPMCGQMLRTSTVVDQGRRCRLSSPWRQALRASGHPFSGFYPGTILPVPATVDTLRSLDIEERLDGVGADLAGSPPGASHKYVCTLRMCRTRRSVSQMTSCRSSRASTCRSRAG